MTLSMLVPLEVGIAVRDLPRMRRFYEQVLGFAFVSEIAACRPDLELSAITPRHS